MTDPRLQVWILAPLALGACYLLAPWPGLQAVVHTLLVLGIAPAFRTPLGAVLWACAAGWTAESALHLYPRLGGTPMADMALALLAWWMRAQWPPEGRTAFWSRMGTLAAFHIVLVHAVVRLAAGPHAWGWIWVWPLATVPLWGTLAWRLQKVPVRK